MSSKRRKLIKHSNPRHEWEASGEAKESELADGADGHSDCLASS
jgi:hypothetical protein